MMSSAQPSDKINSDVMPHDNDSMAKKVLADIVFLEDRLVQLEKQRTPNTVVIKTYKDMLQSRQSVLAWLKEHRASSSRNIQ